MKRKETVDYHIKSTWHALARMYNQKAAVEKDLTSSIGFVLININTTEGTPATKIAPLMGLESRSLTRILKSMEGNGLIYKEKDQFDKRLVRIFLSEKGAQLKSLSVQTILEFNGLVREALTEEELKTFFRIFLKINNVINDFQLQSFIPYTATEERNKKLYYS